MKVPAVVLAPPDLRRSAERPFRLADGKLLARGAVPLA